MPWLLRAGLPMLSTAVFSRYPSRATERTAQRPCQPWAAVAGRRIPCRGVSRATTRIAHGYADERRSLEDRIPPSEHRPEHEDHRKSDHQARVGPCPEQRDFSGCAECERGKGDQLPSRRPSGDARTSRALCSCSPREACRGSRPASCQTPVRRPARATRDPRTRFLYTRTPLASQIREPAVIVGKSLNLRLTRKASPYAQETPPGRTPWYTRVTGARPPAPRRRDTFGPSGVRS